MLYQQQQQPWYVFGDDNDSSCRIESYRLLVLYKTISFSYPALESGTLSIVHEARYQVFVYFEGYIFFPTPTSEWCVRLSRRGSRVDLQPTQKKICLNLCAILCGGIHARNQYQEIFTRCTL